MEANSISKLENENPPAENGTTTTMAPPLTPISKTIHNYLYSTSFKK
jgi:hypothetical protein